MHVRGWLARLWEKGEKKRFVSLHSQQVYWMHHLYSPVQRVVRSSERFAGHTSG
jgi:hypothetical protein